MKRTEIVSISVDGQPATIGAGGVIGEFKPNMRVEVRLHSKLKTAVAVNRDGVGNYTSRRINEGGELILKTAADSNLFSWPTNLIQFVWTYHGVVKIMTVAVIRRDNAVKVVEQVIFEGPIKVQDGTISIPGGKSWLDLLRLAQEAGLLSYGQIQTGFLPKPRIPIGGLAPNTGIIYWWNPTLRGNVDKHGFGGNGYGQAVIEVGGKQTVASIVASNFVGEIPDVLAPGTVIHYERLLPLFHHSSHNPRITGVKVKT